MKAKQKYVAGFMFDEPMVKVALIRKNKPEWQSGLLNGIGGKVEQDENFHYAMAREFKEESGVWVPCWNELCSMSGNNNDGAEFEIEFFYCRGFLDSLKSMESEKIEIVSSRAVAAGDLNTIGNLPWLIALALDFGKGIYPPSKISAKYYAIKPNRL